MTEKVLTLSEARFTAYKKEDTHFPLELVIANRCAEILTLEETIALRDFLNSLDLDEKKDCEDGQRSGDTGKCSECGRTYIHGAK